MARRKLKACGSMANGFIHLSLISGFCLKKYTEGERGKTQINGPTFWKNILNLQNLTKYAEVEKLRCWFLCMLILWYV